jgi:hypothetical protein
MQTLALHSIIVVVLVERCGVTAYRESLLL